MVVLVVLWWGGGGVVGRGRGSLTARSGTASREDGRGTVGPRENGMKRRGKYMFFEYEVLLYVHKLYSPETQQIF